MFRRLNHIGLILLPAILALIIWEWSVAGSQRLTFLFGAPSLIWDKALEEYVQTSIWKDIGITAFEALTGLLIGSVLGTASALLLWMNKTAQKLAYPYITLIGSIPIFALAPMLIIWFGIGIMAKVVMAAFGVFVITIVQTFEGINNTAQQHIDYAHIVGASKKNIMLKILLPSAARWLITGLRINIGIAILGAFIGEFISSQAGLGHYIIQAGQIYDIPGALFGILNLSLLALLLDYLLRKMIPKQFGL